jgi:hypothetical protein
MTGLQRHKPMKRAKLLARTALSRGKPLARKGRVKPRNPKRKAEQFARNFGDEAEAVRALPCLCRGGGPVVRCEGDVVDAHVVSRGAGGGRFDVVPLCDGHHTEQHRVGIRTFAASYGLDLRAAADRVALEHAAPLGIRGLARRWLGCPGGYTCEDGKTDSGGVDQADRPISIKCPDCNGSPPKALDTYELAALLGWARRRMRVWAGRFPRSSTDHREAIAHAVMLDLCEPFTSDTAGEHGLAWSLCDAAGWPS